MYILIIYVIWRKRERERERERARARARARARPRERERERDTGREGERQRETDRDPFSSPNMPTLPSHGGAFWESFRDVRCVTTEPGPSF